MEGAKEGGGSCESRGVKRRREEGQGGEGGEEEGRGGRRR